MRAAVAHGNEEINDEALKKAWRILKNSLEEIGAQGDLRGDID
jgi:hypothetical protein